MIFQINQNKLTEEVKKKIFKGFSQQALESTGIDGLSEEPISFEIYDETLLVGAIVVQPFWGQLHIKYLFVEKDYREQGIARMLMNHALEFGRKRECHFAFVETMSFQAPEFYKKMGFTIEFSRAGYAENTSFHYLKKPLNDGAILKRITRIGVYGVATNDEKMLVVKQKSGPYAGKFDFPGGGIEFGESPEAALQREFVEEVGMKFDSMQLIANLTTTIDAPEKSFEGSYIFYQIGMIYRVNGCRRIKSDEPGDLEHFWINPMALSEGEASSLLWQWIKMQ